MLGSADASAYGRPWMLPCAPAGTLRQLAARLAQKLDRAITVAQVPRWVVSVSAMFVPLMRELNEMLYQWDEPVDDDRAAAETVDWVKQHYGTVV
jgi:hypothetical protein